MSLRTIETRTAMGDPLDIVVVTREQISFEQTEVTLDAINDDGESIKAVCTFADGIQRLLTLYEDYDYAPIATLTDEVIDARIQVLVAAMAE